MGVSRDYVFPLNVQPLPTPPSRISGSAIFFFILLGGIDTRSWYGNRKQRQKNKNKLISFFHRVLAIWKREILFFRLGQKPRGGWRLRTRDDVKTRTQIYKSFENVHNFEPKLELHLIAIFLLHFTYFFRFYLFGLKNMSIYVLQTSAWLVPGPNSRRFLTHPEVKFSVSRWLKRDEKKTISVFVCLFVSSFFFFRFPHHDLV